MIHWRSRVSQGEEDPGMGRVGSGHPAYEETPAGPLPRAKHLLGTLSDRAILFVAGRLSVPIYRSGFFTSPLDYGRKVFHVSLIAVLASSMMALALASLYGTLSGPMLGAFAAAALIPPFAVMALIAYPFLAVSRRQRLCARELPFMATYLTMSAASGVSMQGAFEQLKGLVHLPQFRNESLRIEKVRRLYALNMYEAITFEGKCHPAESVRELYLASVAAQREGGDVFSILKDEIVKIFTTIDGNLRTISDKFSVLASAEMVSFIMIPMGFITIGVLFSSLLGIPALIAICFVFPTATAVLLGLAIDTYIPKELTEPIPYGGFARCLLALPFVALLAVLATAFGLPPYYCFGLSLISLVLPIMLHYAPARKRTREVLAALPVFARLIAEEVKKGSAPKLAIANLSELRSFNQSFDRLLRKISAFLKIGYPISDAAASVDAPWIAKVSFELMDKAETMGAEPRSLDVLSELVRGIYMSFKSLDSQTRLFTITSCLNSIILSFSVAITVEIVAKLFSTLGGGAMLISLPLGMSFISSGQLAMVQNIAYASVIYDSFLLGVLGGKASNGGSIVDGLRTGVICATLAMLGIVVFKDLGLIGGLMGGFGGLR